MRAALHPPTLAFLAALGLALVPSVAAALSPLDDPGRRDLLVGGPSVRDGSLGAFVNPASWGTTVDPDFALWWNDVSVDHDALDNFGVSFGGPIGLSFQRFTAPQAEGLRRVQEVQLGGSTGNRNAHVGMAWRFAGGDDEELNRDSGAVLGGIFRTRRVSWGIASFLSTESGDRNGVIDLGIRPWGGRSALMVFGDYSLRDDDRPDDGVWSAGLGVRPFSGVHLGVRIVDGPDEEHSFVAQVGLYGRGSGAEVLSGFDDDVDRGATTMIVRGGHPIRPIETHLGEGRKRRVAVVDLEDREITYQKDLWFDEESVPWLSLARRLRAIEKNPDFDEVAVNLASVGMGPSFAWEMREALLAIRRAGKKITVHMDRASMTLVYVASAADRVTIDPVGSMRIPGVAMQRTYFAGLLDKLGLGFEELRHFKYKSAMETFSRATMSDVDREQYGRMVDVIYETMRDGISSGRGLKLEEFDAIVEEGGILTSAESVERGLADHTARWSEIEDAFEEEGAKLEEVSLNAPSSRFLHEERWGRPPTIAVVYAEGVCAMDVGIRGHATSKHLEDLADRSDVDAVVLRADSPGGDPLPADLVAGGLARCRSKKKPVVVSQGDVAASGGYLISLESDRLLTTPLTITGSIGVIGGWVWDAGVGAKTGTSADGVQRGSHADLFAGLRVPLLGVRIPTRPLRDDERERSRETILEYYDVFVSRVATARHRTKTEIEEVAQGRVWMGGDAIQQGLCDDLGGLLDAVEGAALRAGIAPEEEWTVQEYPPRRRFRLPFGLAGISAATPIASPEDWALRSLRLFASDPGAPLFVLPPDALPVEWDPAP